MELREQLPSFRLVSSQPLAERVQPLVQLKHLFAELALRREGSEDRLDHRLRREQLAEGPPPLRVLAEARVSLQRALAALAAEIVLELGDEGVRVVEQPATRGATV